jgi:hypothetical protein
MGRQVPMETAAQQPNSHRGGYGMPLTTLVVGQDGPQGLAVKRTCLPT